MRTQPIACTLAILITGSVLLLTGISCINDTDLGNNDDGSTVTDADGNVYRTVKIGNQVWTTENLRTTKYNDGSPIPHAALQTTWDSSFYNLQDAYCYYKNTTNADNIKKFGALYNWYAVNTGKLAPAGWHVPTDEEWDTLMTYLITNGYNWDGANEGNNIAKSMAAKEKWESSNMDGAIGNDLTKNNKSGFSAVPGGGRDPADADHKGFYGIDSVGCWWSSTDWGSTCTWNRSLSYDFSDFLRPFSGKNCGFSVRLVRNSN
jgi:uncharacterized protein (TIGR02145 family)